MFINFESTTLDSSTLNLANKISALGALKKSISDACDGTLDFKYHLCPIDPGGGKSQTLIQVLRERKAAGILGNSGIIICTHSIAEIQAFVAAVIHPEGVGTRLDVSDFAVFTSREGDNALGSTDVDSAPVLFTTHAMADSRLRPHKFFRDAACFHYKGQPRVARIWDEAFQPARPVTISLDDLDAAPSFYRKHSVALVDQIDLLKEEIARTQNGHFIKVPDDMGFVAQGLLSDEDNELERKAKNLLDMLIAAAGRRLKVIQKNNRERVLVGCSKPFPEDLKPMIVMDASIRVNGGYEIWERSGETVRLPECPNDYRNLSVSYWRTGVGVDAMRKKVPMIAGAIAELIRNKPNEKWLIICKKKFITLRKAIANLAPKDADITFPHWGIHKATNDFRDIRNVVLVGPLSYGEEAYRSICAAWERSGKMACTQEDIDDVKRGTFADDLLQAATRGNIRNVDGSGVGGACSLYVITGRADRDIIESTFPGCSVQEWVPVQKALPPRARSVIDAISGRFSDSTCMVATKKEIYTALGISGTSFSNALRNERVRKAITEAGLVLNRTTIARPPNDSPS